jgi:hypothetical protein
MDGERIAGEELRRLPRLPRFRFPVHPGDGDVPLPYEISAPLRFQFLGFSAMGRRFADGNCGNPKNFALSPKISENRP